MQDAAQPTVTVALATYNHARYLAAALDSVRRQTAPATEVIVVDDGSDDDPGAVVAGFPGVRLIRKANGGLSSARNAALAASGCDLILFLDADDLLAPSAIADGLACLARRPDAAFVYGGHCRVDADGTPITGLCYTPVGMPPFDTFLRGNAVGMHATVLYRRARLLAAGGFDEALPRCEDYDVYLRLSRSDPVASHAGLTAFYRWHAANMSHDQERMLHWALAVLDRNAAAGPLTPAQTRHLAVGRAQWRAYYAVERLARAVRRRRPGEVAAAAVGILRASPLRAMRELTSRARASFRAAADKQEVFR